MYSKNKVDLKNYRVIVNEQNETDYFAAKELTKYVFLATGADLPVNAENAEYKNKIIIGGDYSDVRGTDGFSVTVDDTVTIKGDCARGTLYGVYDFLEKFLGIRFLTSYYTYIPKKAGTVIRKTSYSSQPDFKWRTYLFAGMEGEFSAKVRMYNEVFSTPSYCGGSIKWNCSYAQNHNMLFYVSPSVYYTDENKEENKHLFCFDEKGVPVDICYTDGLTDDGAYDKSVKTSAFGITLEKMKNLLLSDKDSVFFPIEQMDTLIYCNCERCRKAEKKYGRGGMNIRFANALSRELKQWLKQQGIEREFYLVIFAYNYSSMPPVKWENGQYVPIDETVKAEDNVVVRIATIKENCYYPLQSDMHFVPISKQIAGWKAVCKNIMTWTYHKNFKCFLWYFPTIQHWKQDCKFLKDNAVFYNFMQSNHLEKTDWISEIELYVAGKTLWNIETDPYAVRKEFIRLFYGVAAPFVNKIIRIFDGNYKKIAKKSEKLRRQTFLKVNGIPLKEAFGIHDMNALGNMLLEESKEEWTHNVYFSLYHKEIMWAKSQPKELLEKQLALVFAAKNKVKAKKYQKDDENRIIIGLEKIELAVRFMILYNYNEYYGEKGKAEFVKRFIELCDKFNYEYIGELRVSSFSDFIDKGCDLC